MTKSIKRTTVKRQNIAASARRRINLSSTLKSKTRLSGNSGATEGILDKIIFGSLISIFTICPLFFTGLSVQGIGFEKMILFSLLVLVGTIACIAKGIKDGEFRFKRTVLDLPIIGLIIVAIVSTIFSESIKDSLVGPYGSFQKSFAALIIFILFYYLLINNVNAKRIRILFWSFIVSSSVITIYSLAQLFDFFILPFKFAQTINFNPIELTSNLAMFLVITLPLLIVAINNIKGVSKKGVKILLIVVLLVNLITLVSIRNFTFWPLIFIISLIIIIFGLAKIVKVERKHFLIPIVILFVSILFIIDNNVCFPDKEDKKGICFKDVAKEEIIDEKKEIKIDVKFLPDYPFGLNLQNEIHLMRSASWRIAKNSLKEDPILGSGPATFYYAFDKYKDLSLNKNIYWNQNFNSMGIFFELLATLGILGTLVIIILLAIAIASSFMLLLKIRDNEDRLIALGLFISASCLIIFSFLFAVSAALIICFALILSLCFISSIIFSGQKEKVFKIEFSSKQKKKIIIVSLISFIVLICLIFLLCKMYLADIYAKKSIDATDVNQKISILNKAIKKAPYQDSYYVVLSNFYNALAGQSNAAGNKSAAIENLQKSLKFSEKALSIAPNKSENNKSLALAYESLYIHDKSSLEKAENQYRRVMELEPNNPIPYLRLGLINITRANAETDDEEKKHYINEAINNYDKAIERKNDIPEIYHGKSIAYENLGDIDKAIENLEISVAINQNNMNYWFELGRLYFNKGISIAQLPPSQNITDQEYKIRQIREARGIIDSNNEIAKAEEIFLSILYNNQKHANARYSLAMLYNKIGDADKASIMVKSLLQMIDNEKQKEQIREQFKGLY